MSEFHIQKHLELGPFFHFHPSYCIHNVFNVKLTQVLTWYDTTLTVLLIIIGLFVLMCHGTDVLY